MQAAVSTATAKPGDDPNDLSAQCPACSLHELVTLTLYRDPNRGWQADNPRRPPGCEELQIDTCPVCFGVWFDQGELDVLGDAEVDPALLKTLVGQSADRLCPRGHGFMNEHQLPGLLRTPIDRCPTCRGLWIDGYERHQLAHSSTSEGQEDIKLKVAKRGFIWAAQLLLQLPVEVENPARSTPWVVYCLSALMFGLFMLSVLGVLYFDDYALSPRELGQSPTEMVHLATHLFFHAGWMHLLGNLYFLYVFGDNIEHLFGTRRFVGLLALAGIGGALVHSVVTGSPDTLLVGASGSIAGVMAAYLWSFPRAKLLQVIPIVFIQLKIPAWLYLTAWFGFQVAISMSSDQVELAWADHVGGFLIGAMITPWVLRLRRREVATRVRFPSAACVLGEYARKSRRTVSDVIAGKRPSEHLTVAPSAWVDPVTNKVQSGAAVAPVARADDTRSPARAVSTELLRPGQIGGRESIAEAARRAQESLAQGRTDELER